MALDVSHTPRRDSDSLDDQIAQARIEHHAALRLEKATYNSALKYHNNMFDRKIQATEENLDKWDRAIIIIRNYRTKYFFEEFEDD